MRHSKGKEVLSVYDLKYEVPTKKAFNKNKRKKKLAVDNPGDIRFDIIGGYFVSKFKSFHKFIVRSLEKYLSKGKKMTKKERENARLASIEQGKRGIIGIGQLLVVMSIIYSTTVIFIGVNSIASRIALAPQVAFAAIILLRAFFRLYK